jgi:hypothetical protein
MKASVPALVAVSASVCGADETELLFPTDSTLEKLRHINNEEYARPDLLPDFKVR